MASIVLQHDLYRESVSFTPVSRPTPVIGLLVFLLLTSPRGVYAVFEDVSDLVGLPQVFSKTFGNPIWVDFNNDGLLDVVNSQHSNRMNVYMNRGDGTYDTADDDPGRIASPAIL